MAYPVPAAAVSDVAHPTRRATSPSGSKEQERLLKIPFQIPASFFQSPRRQSVQHFCYPYDLAIMSVGYKMLDDFSRWPGSWITNAQTE